MGRGNRGDTTGGGGGAPPSGRGPSRPEDVSSVLEDAARKNGSLGIDDYARYGVLSDQLNPLTDSKFSREQVAMAREAIAIIERLGSVESIGRAKLSSDGLAIAEGVYEELAEEGGMEEISEGLDPDREFMFQSDGDHLSMMAEYMRILRTGAAGQVDVSSMGESHWDHHAARADAARDAAKYE